MKKLSFLFACLLSLTFPGLNASSSDVLICPKEPKEKAHACKHKCKHICRRHEPVCPLPLGQASLEVPKETPVQLGTIPLTSLRLSRLEMLDGCVKVNKTGLYLITVSFRAVATDTVGPLSVFLTFGTEKQAKCPGCIPVPVTEKKTRELFSFEESGKLQRFCKTAVKLSAGDLVGLSIESLPTSGSVVYPAGRAVTMTIQRIG